MLIQSNPLISVVMILYNHKPFLKEAIEGVLSQTYSNLELIVVDDSSTDGSYEFLQTFTDNRIRIFRQENSGPSVALNFGLRQAKGQYVATTASDDIFYPDKIERQFQEFNNNPNLSAVCTHVNFINESSQDIDTPIQFSCAFNTKNQNRSNLLLGFLINGNCLNASSAMFQKILFDKSGYFHPASMQLQDWDFYFRCIDFGEILVIPEKLMAYRVRSDGGNLSSSLNGIRSENEGYFILPNLLNSIYRNCTNEDIVKCIKDRNSTAINIDLEKASKPLLIYLLCKTFPENLILQVVSIQFLASKLEEESLWDVHTAQTFFKDLTLIDVGGRRQMLDLYKIIETYRHELETLKSARTFKIGRLMLRIPAILKRLIFSNRI